MIARQGLAVALNNVAGAVQGFLALFLVARYMGDEALGARAYAIALVSLVGIVARLGLPTTHVRRLARGRPLGSSIGAFITLKAGLTALFMLVAGAAWFWLGDAGRTVTDTTPTALVLGFWVVVAQSLRDVPVATFQGLRRIRDREAVLFTNTFVTVALTALVALAFAASHGRWSPIPGLGDGLTRLLGVTGPLTLGTGIDLLMAAVLVGEVAALLLAVVLFARARLPVERPDRATVAAYLAFTLPLMLLAVGEVATKWSSQVLLGFWWDASELGQFAAPSKLSELLLLLGLSLTVVLLPAVSDLHARGRDGEAAALVRKAERWTSLLLWPVVAVLALVPGSVIHILLSDRFAPGIPVLVILAVQALLTSLLMPVQALAIGAGHTRFASRVILATLAVTLVLSLVLVPPPGSLPTLGLGASGAALAALGGTALALVLYRIPTPTWPGHAFLRRDLLIHLAAAAAVFLLFHFLPIPAPTRFVGLGLYAVAAVAVYAGLLVAVGELHKGDWRDLREMLGISKSP